MTKGEDTQRRILDVALKMVSRDGLEQLSIGNLAAETGMSKSGLFAHFGSKEQLQLAVLNEAEERFLQTVVRPALKAPRGEPRLRMAFERWLDWGNGRSLPGGCVFVAVANELDDRPGPLRDHLVTSQRAWLDTVARMARQAVEAGHFRPDIDADQFAFHFYSVILGFHHVSRLLHDPRAEERLRRAFEGILTAARHHPELSR